MRRPCRSLCLILGTWLAAPAAAQLNDIQPGRNFPSASSAFGSGRSENIDVGDVDNDGDYDVVVANGGDGSAQDNRLYINSGGIQGGVAGTFVDETATRFAGIPADTSRDIELADIDGDFDLDVYVCNRGTTVNGGEVARAYINQGGVQLGAIGHFIEGTEAFWGTLVSVPLSSEVGVQDGQGPWRGHSGDADFADLDDDGDLDLFHSSNGVITSGTIESRIFLNDGQGRFDELWPWADAAADVELHSFDCDLADLDGDFDIDVIGSSRDSQSRVYRNNLVNGAWPGDPFTDLTQTALIDTGATQAGGSTYETEFADMDGDGDFDLWMVDYVGFGDSLLRNDGHFTFSSTTWLRGDPQEKEHEADFLDYDGDGDLDVFLANFAGTNFIYQSGLAQGLDEVDGLYHRTGTTAAGSLAAWAEAPSSGNGQATRDGECADMDGDGDPDILLANAVNGLNRYWENVLGTPDTHAPTIYRLTQQADKSDGSDTPIRVQVRDNAGHYIVAYSDARLFYRVDGGVETCLPMASQGSMQFRGVIPGGIDGVIDYRVEVTDDAGNTGASGTTQYTQTSSGVVLWESLDCGTEGISGRPFLQLSGPATAGSTLTLSLRDAAPTALFLLWIATPANTPADVLGGTVHAIPFVEQILLATDEGGMFYASTLWPAGTPAGVQSWWQCLVADASQPYGLVLSNAVHGTTP